jgi:hypothetical protein
MDLIALRAASNGYLTAVGSPACTEENPEFDEYPSLVMYVNTDVVRYRPSHGLVSFDPATGLFHGDRGEGNDHEADTFLTLAETLDWVRGEQLVPEDPTVPRALTHAQQDSALAIVAAWLGKDMGYDGPAPTGEQAYRTGQGPVLVRDWEPTWSGGPRPTLLLEGGPEEWAVRVAADRALCTDLHHIGVRPEPQAGYALCLYNDWI